MSTLYKANEATVGSLITVIDHTELKSACGGLAPACCPGFLIVFLTAARMSLKVYKEYNMTKAREHAKITCVSQFSGLTLSAFGAQSHYSDSILFL